MMFRLFIFVGFLSCGVFGHSINDTNKLYKKLMTDYNKDVRGTLDQTEPTWLSVQFHLISINSYSDVTGTFSLVGYFTFEWTDDRMIWNPTEYNDQYSITFPESQVWIPTIILSNSQREEDILVLGNDKILVRYDPDGTTYWYPGHLFLVFCASNIRDYPFDTQVLLLNIFTHNSFNQLKIKQMKKHIRFYAPAIKWQGGI